MEVYVSINRSILLTIMLLILLIIVRLVECERITPRFHSHSSARLYSLHLNLREEQYAIITPAQLIGNLNTLAVSTKKIFFEFKSPAARILWRATNTDVEDWSLSNENNRADPETG